MFDEEKNALFCKLCINANEILHNNWGNLDEGCKNFKKDQCEKHIERECHKRAKTLDSIRRDNLNIEQFLNIKKEPLSHNNSGQYNINQEYRNLFKNVYWGCREEVAILKIVSLHDYTKYLLHVEIPDYHLSRKSTMKVINAIGSLQRKKFLEEINDIQDIGILIDESTDVSHKSILLLYVRFYSIKQNKICESFLKLFELEQANAQYIYDKVKTFLITEKLFHKVKFLCTDGAPTVSSIQDGVAGKLKRELPKSNSFKCVCHQENLALKHTYKKFENLSGFNKKLANIIFYFQNSPKKIRILEDFQMEMEFDTIFKLIRAKEIRWNSFFYATNRIRQLYPAIIKTLAEIERIVILKEELKEALDIKEIITDFNFVFILNWLSDFLNPICHLNKQLQASNYEIAYLKEQIIDTINIIRNDYSDSNKQNLNDNNNI